MSPQMYEAIVKLMGKSEGGVDHFAHIELPSLEKFADLSRFHLSLGTEIGRRKEKKEELEEHF